MIELKISCIILCGVLNSLGGYCALYCRRFIMPFVIALTVSILTHIFWLGLIVLPSILTLSFGYKRFGSGNFSRALWLVVQGFALGIGLTLTHHLSLFLFLPYILTLGVLGGTLVRVWQPLGDLIEGCFLGIIVCLIH